MSGYDGFGNFTRGYNWVQDKANAIKIQAARMDGEFDIYATALNQVFLRNGVVAMSGDLPLGGNKITGVAAGAEATPSFASAADVTTGMFFPATGVMGFSAAGVERARVTDNGFVIPVGQFFGVGTAAPRTQLDVAGITSLRSVYEDTLYSTTALTGTVQVDALTQAVVIYDTNAAGNWTFNIRGDTSNSLNSVMAIGQTVTLAIEVPQGATAYYCTTVTVDGAGTSQLKWFGAIPVAGNISGIDVYTITIYKKAASTFYVRASLNTLK